MTTLKDLAAMLDAATGPSREIDEAIARALHLNPVQCADGPELTGRTAAWAGGGEWWGAPSWSFSIDAALALVEQLLPGVSWDMQHLYEGAQFRFRRYHAPINGIVGSAPTAPLAILKALVAALIAQEADHG